MITPMAAYIPPGWPTGVHPPGSEDFEATAIAWLLDVVPPDFRLHGVVLGPSFFVRGPQRGFLDVTPPA